MGGFFQKMDEAEPSIAGFVRIIWSEGRLESVSKGELQKFIDDEKGEFISKWTQLQDAKLSFGRPAIQDKLSWCLEKRSSSSISLSNQDTSPESIIIRDGRVHLIDPRPVLYSGVVFAGKHVNNYKTLFPTYSETPRYMKDQFHKHKEVHYAMAVGL